MTPTVAHIALGSVAVSCPYSAVTRASRADFFSGAGVVHIYLVGVVGIWIYLLVGG